MSFISDAIPLLAGSRITGSGNAIAGQVRTWIRLVTFAAPSLFLAAVLLQPWVEPKWMFLDPLTSAELSGDCCHAYYGFVSNVGVMAWVATAAVCLFGAAIMSLHGREKPLIWFALSAGLLTGWLSLDDALMLHELVLPSFGVPQNLVLASYVALGLLYAVSSWRIILTSDYVILFVGGAALVLSIAVDTVFHSLLPSLVSLEDSAKFFGICCWASFHITTIAGLMTRPSVDLRNRAGMSGIASPQTGV